MSFRVSINNAQQSSKLGGWTENFWNSNSDLSSTVTITRALRSALDDVKGAQCYMPSARISAIPPAPRNVLNYLWTGSSPLAPGAGSPDADYPSTALLLKFTGPPSYTTEQWIRGLPDQIVALSGTYQPGRLSGYSSKMAALLAVLTSGSNGWSMRCLDVNVLPTPVTAIDYTSGIVTSPAHGLGGPGTILRARIKGWTGYRPVNKIWRCTVIDINTVQLSFWTIPPTGSGVGGNNPTIRKQSYVLVPIQTATVVRATSHYTGRPTGLLGGRRKKRVKV